MEVEVQPLTYVEQMKLAAEIVTRGEMMSQTWWNMAKVASSVRKIDGRKVLKPQHARHILKILEDLGDDGWTDAVRQFNTYRVERDETMTITVSPVTMRETWAVADFAGHLFDVPPWRGLALVALSVRSFNGADLEFPTSIKELYSLVEELGFHGMDLAVEQAALNRAAQQDDSEKEQTVPAGN